MSGRAPEMLNGDVVYPQSGPNYHTPQGLRTAARMGSLDAYDNLIRHVMMSANDANTKYRKQHLADRASSIIHKLFGFFS